MYARPAWRCLVTGKASRKRRRRRHQWAKCDGINRAVSSRSSRSMYHGRLMSKRKSAAWRHRASYAAINVAWPAWKMAGRRRRGARALARRRRAGAGGRDGGVAAASDAELARQQPASVMTASWLLSWRAAPAACRRAPVRPPACPPACPAPPAPSARAFLPHALCPALLYSIQFTCTCPSITPFYLALPLYTCPHLFLMVLHLMRFSYTTTPPRTCRHLMVLMVGSHVPFHSFSPSWLYLVLMFLIQFFQPPHTCTSFARSFFSRVPHVPHGPHTTVLCFVPAPPPFLMVVHGSFYTICRPIFWTYPCWRYHLPHSFTFSSFLCSHSSFSFSSFLIFFHLQFQRCSFFLLVQLLFTFYIFYSIPFVLSFSFGHLLVVIFSTSSFTFPTSFQFSFLLIPPPPHFCSMFHVSFSTFSCFLFLFLFPHAFPAAPPPPRFLMRIPSQLLFLMVFLMVLMDFCHFSFPHSISFVTHSSWFFTRCVWLVLMVLFLMVSFFSFHGHGLFGRCGAVLMPPDSSRVLMVHLPFACRTTRRVHFVLFHGYSATTTAISCRFFSTCVTCSGSPRRRFAPRAACFSSCSSFVLMVFLFLTTRLLPHTTYRTPSYSKDAPPYHLPATTCTHLPTAGGRYTRCCCPRLCCWPSPTAYGVHGATYLPGTPHTYARSAHAR